MLSLPAQQVLISAVATVPQNLFKIPAELLKQRAQLSPVVSQQSASRELSFLGVLQDAQRLGLRGLYQGGGAMMLREIPFNAVQMSAFYFLKEQRAADLTSSVIASSADPVLQSALLGLVAAGLAALVTQPADTIKTRLMKEDAAGETVIGMARKIVKASGWRGLYVGLGYRLLLVSIGGLIYFATLELTDGVGAGHY